MAFTAIFFAASLLFTALIIYLVSTIYATGVNATNYSIRVRGF